MTNKEIITILEMSNPLRNVPEDMREQFPYSELKEAYDRAIEALENQKIGHWLDYGVRYDVRCSICNTQYPLKFVSSSRLMGCKSNYCPNCGAKMEGE